MQLLVALLLVPPGWISRYTATDRSESLTQLASVSWDSSSIADKYLDGSNSAAV